MIIVMQPQANETAIARVVDTIRQRGLREHISRGTERTIIGAMGDERVFDAAEFECLPQVERAIKIMHNWRIISREAWATDANIVIRGISFGAEKTQLVDSLPKPESKAVLLDPFYIPTNPYTFPSSLNEKEISQKLIQQITYHHQQNQVVFVRIRDSQHLDSALKAQADALYLGGELLSNPHILRTIGSLNTPVVVCKDVHHSIHDWLMTAEKIALRGNQHIILGEAGSLSLNDRHLRLDVDAIAAAKQLSYLPILANISQLSHRNMPCKTLLALAKAAGATVVMV